MSETSISSTSSYREFSACGKRRSPTRVAEASAYGHLLAQCNGGASVALVTGFHLHKQCCSKMLFLGCVSSCLSSCTSHSTPQQGLELRPLLRPSFSPLFNRCGCRPHFEVGRQSETSQQRTTNAQHEHEFCFPASTRGSTSAARRSAWSWSSTPSSCTSGS